MSLLAKKLMMCAGSGDSPWESVLVGSEIVFNSGTGQTDYISITRLTDNTAIVAYHDYPNFNKGTARVLTVSGTTITIGAEKVFESNRADAISITRLTDNTALVVYQDNVNSNRGTACVLTVSGTTISAGAETVFNSGYSYRHSVTKLTDVTAIVAYCDQGNSYFGTACVLTVSGTTISAGAETVFNSAHTNFISIIKLTDTTAIVAYRCGGTPYYGDACVLTISGTTISAGTIKRFNYAAIEFTSIAKLTDTTAIVGYRDLGTSNYGVACVLTVSGTTITVGSKKTFNPSDTWSISIDTLTDSTVLVVYRDDGTSDYGIVSIFTISGSTISTGSEVVFNSGYTYYTSLSKLNDNTAIVAYRDDGNSNYGTACVLYKG